MTEKNILIKAREEGVLSEEIDLNLIHQYPEEYASLMKTLLERALSIKLRLQEQTE